LIHTPRNSLESWRLDLGAMTLILKNCFDLLVAHGSYWVMSYQSVGAEHADFSGFGFGLFFPRFCIMSRKDILISISSGVSSHIPIHSCGATNQFSTAMSCTIRSRPLCTRPHCARRTPRPDIHPNYDI
jgi:hypothetical protein